MDSLKPAQRLAIDFHDFEKDSKGFNSLMLITDRFSGLCWDFYLQDRRATTIVSTLKWFFDMIQYRFELKPKVVECDNEITTQKPKVTQFLQEELKISVEPSAPYTQAQNGEAERSGGVIKEKAGAMVGSLPSKLWREVVSAAVYLFNRTPRYMNRWKTPYELFHGHPPSQDHLRAYGCKAFAMTTSAKKKENRLKRLDKKAWIGYLVGYTSTNIYRVWIPVRNEVILTRDVTFDESSFFDGNLDRLAQDVKDMDMDHLASFLQSIAFEGQSASDDVITESAAATEDPGLFDCEFPTDETETESMEEFPSSEELLSSEERPSSAQAEEKGEDPFQLLTPPDTPMTVAALLSTVIQSAYPRYHEEQAIQCVGNEHEGTDHPLSQGKRSTQKGQHSRFSLQM